MNTIAMKTMKAISRVTAYFMIAVWVIYSVCFSYLHLPEIKLLVAGQATLTNDFYFKYLLYLFLISVPACFIVVTICWYKRRK
jgi:hypothetical protein